MHARTTARPLAALAAIALVIAACGNGAATTAPVTQAPATQPPATAAATQGAVATDGVPSFALPSFHSDQQLEDLFPDQVGGTDVTVLSMTGDQFMVGGSSPELDAALGSLGKTASDLSVAFGSAGTVTIIAFKVAGVPGSSIFSALFDAYKQTNDATITDETIAGKAVKKAVPTDDSGTSYLYSAQDVVFAVGGSPITDAELTEVFSKLP